MIDRDLEWLGEEEYAQLYEEEIKSHDENMLAWSGFDVDVDISKEAKRSRGYREWFNNTYYGKFANAIMWGRISHRYLSLKLKYHAWYQ